MSDTRLRDLERVWLVDGDDTAADAYDQACRQAGTPSPPRTLAYVALVRVVGRWGMRRFLQQVAGLQERIYEATQRRGYNYLMVGEPVVQEFIAAHHLNLHELVAQGHIVIIDSPATEDDDAPAPLR